MKKVILPLAFAAAIACSNVSAQTVPNWYSYQGVCSEKSEQIEVTFQLNNDQGEAVYKEVQTIQTSETGAFTAKLGQGTATYGDWMFGIDWTACEYTLATFINGAQVSEAPLGAVPYATVAETVAGIDATELSDMAITVKGLSAEVNTLSSNMETILADGEGLIAQLQLMDTFMSNRIEDTDAAVAALEDGLSITQEDVMNLTLGNKENKAAIADLQQNMETILADGEGLIAQLQLMDTFMSNRIEDTDAALAELDDVVANVSSDVQGIQESLRGKASVDAVEALAEGLDATQEDVINLTEGNKENKAAIAELQQVVEGLMEADGTTAQFITNLANRIEDTDAAVANLDDAVANVSSDVQGIQESLRGKASVDAVEALADGLDATQQDVINLTEGNKENKAAIADLKAALENHTNDYNDLYQQVARLNEQIAYILGKLN